MSLLSKVLVTVRGFRPLGFRPVASTMAWAGGSGPYQTPNHSVLLPSQRMGCGVSHGRSLHHYRQRPLSSTHSQTQTPLVKSNPSPREQNNLPSTLEGKTSIPPAGVKAMATSTVTTITGQVGMHPSVKALDGGSRSDLTEAKSVWPDCSIVHSCSNK